MATEHSGSTSAPVPGLTGWRTSHPIRVLERIDVARGFTAFQHFAIVDVIVERARRVAAEDDLTLVVAPVLDAPYGDDALRAVKSVVSPVL